MPGCRLIFGALAAFATATATAAEPEWLKLQAPSFGVISQLSESETRQWATEFDQFISAMRTLYAVEELALPPLTIVLFRQSKDFAPYRMVTASGQAQVSGFFGRTSDWSVIGLSGGGRDSTTRPIIYHEAVHWFTSANETELPLWFAEGLAEVLSTFRVVKGKGRWGETIDNNVNYFAFYGLLPLEELLRASQDEALHGRGSSKYYPQAWAFVHYLMFGNAGAQAKKLADFLRLQRETDLDAAFDAAFGKSYDDMTSELRRYLSSGRYSYAEVDLRDRGDEMTVEPASQGNIEFALGRLAAVAGNQELALAHADRVVALAPNSPAGYELKAYAADQSDDAALEAAVEHAIERGSREASVYAAKADRLIAAHQRESGFLDELLSADVARAAADLYRRAIGLRPRSPAAFAGLSMALLNVDTVTDADQVTLNAGRTMFPTNGMLLVGQAAVANAGGDVVAATRLLGQAIAEPYTLPQGYRRAVTALRNNWVGDWLSKEMGALALAGQFTETRKFIEQQLADETITGPPRTMLENTLTDLPHLERLHAAMTLELAGNDEQSIALLTALVNDPDTRDRIRRQAEKIMRDRGWLSDDARAQGE